MACSPPPFGHATISPAVAVAVPLAEAVYRHLADALVVFHLCFVIFVILGGLLVLKWRRAAWFHLPAVAWGIFVESSGAICPLTPLENHFRQLAGLEAYSGGFVDHYVVPVLYPADNLGGMDFRLFQCLLALLIVALNGTVYYLAFRKARKGKPRTQIDGRG